VCLSPSTTERLKDENHVVWVAYQFAENCGTEFLTLTVGTEAIQRASVVRDLGVLLDPELRKRQHIAKVVSDRFFQLRRLRQLLVLASVTSRLDDWNSVLAGLPASTQASVSTETTAEHILWLKPSDHFTASFLQLHWLPVYYRITYKLRTMIYAIHHNLCPAYMAESVTVTAHHSTRTGLRSSGRSGLYSVPRLRTKFGKRAFSDSGRNSLPDYVRCENNFSSFEKLPKTHFFRLAFNAAYLFPV
jgi:hypothetical protein